MNIIKTFLIRNAGIALAFINILISIAVATTSEYCGKCDVSTIWLIISSCLMCIGAIYTSYILCCTKEVNYDPPVQSGYATMSI